MTLRALTIVLALVGTGAIWSTDLEACSCGVTHPGFVSVAKRAELVLVVDVPDPPAAMLSTDFIEVRVREVLRGEYAGETMRLYGDHGAGCYADPISAALERAGTWVIAPDTGGFGPAVGYRLHAVCARTWAEVQGDLLVGVLRDKDYRKGRHSHMPLAVLRRVLRRR